MRIKTLPRLARLTIAASALLLATTTGAALASESLDQGMKLYKEKKYQEAKTVLEQAAREEPNSWQAHFYLGHTLMTLGRVNDAKHEYEVCKHVSNHPAVQAHCDKALSQVEAYYAKVKPQAGGASASSSAGTAGEGEEAAADAEPTPEDKRKAEVQAKKDKVMQEARDQCTKIRQDAETQIRNEKAGSNQHFRYSDGSIGTDISDEREAEIRAAAEEKCKRIMSAADARARGYR